MTRRKPGPDPDHPSLHTGDHITFEPPAGWRCVNSYGPPDHYAHGPNGWGYLGRFESGRLIGADAGWAGSDPFDPDLHDAYEGYGLTLHSFHPDHANNN